MRVVPRVYSVNQQCTLSESERQLSVTVMRKKLCEENRAKIELALADAAAESKEASREQQAMEEKRCAWGVFNCVDPVS